MKIPRLAVAALLATAASLGITATPVQADPPVVSGYALERHEVALDYGRRASFYDCWDAGAHPVLSVWTGKRWAVWDEGSVSAGGTKCRAGTSKVTYTFNVNQLGKFNRASGYYLVKVKESCRNCLTQTWTLPVFAVTEDRPYPTFIAPKKILLIGTSYSMCPVDFNGKPVEVGFTVEAYDGRDFQIVGLQDEVGRQYVLTSGGQPANSIGYAGAEFVWSGPFPESSTVSAILVRPTKGGVDGKRDIIAVPASQSEIWGTQYETWGTQYCG
ncbi:MAG: hypothetical protein Q8M17_01685 [Actinomycetota bacterium]|nr:hypothetical protein [Actinomycetota bacterium]